MIKPPTLLFLFISVDHRIVLSIQESRFDLVNNADQIISAVDDRKYQQQENNSFQNRQKRNNDPSNIKVLIIDISPNISLLEQ